MLNNVDIYHEAVHETARVTLFVIKESRLMRITSISLISYVLLSFLSACGGGKKAPLAAPPPAPSGSLRLPPAPPRAPECVDLDPAKVLASQEVAKCDGTKVMGLIEACKEDATVGCLTTQTHKSADLTNLQAGNILIGVTIAGVSGSVTPAPADCLSDGETGCVAVTNFPAVDKVNSITANASKIRSSVTIAGVVGSLADCSADGGVGCVAVAAFKAADMSVSIAGNIKTGAMIAGVSGSVTPAPAACSSAGEQSCVATGTYFAGPACGADASNCFLPPYAVSTQPLKAINYNAIDVSKMLDTFTLSGATGTVVSKGSWALTDVFPGTGYYTGVSNAPAAGTMLSGTTVNAVAGTATAAPADCSMNGVTGCVTTAPYLSGDLTNLTEGNIKNGVTIAGVLGLYPNATYKLPSAGGAAGLTNATFDAKVKLATAFEYWTEAGAREQSVGDADITAAKIASGVSIFGLSGSLAAAVAPNAWDVRVGTVVNGVTGMLKVNCRNRVNNTIYNYNGSVSFITNGAVITASGSTDYWDTIDDYNNGVSGLPPGVVSGWTNNDCGGVETVTDDVNVWKDITTTNGTTASNCGATSGNCTMKDKITGLHWSKIQSTSQTWSVAINTCDALTHNSQSDWRLPTQKELMEAYTHGIRSGASANWITEANMSANYFWSGSSISSSTLTAWNVFLARGYTNGDYKANPNQVVCVR